MYGVSAEIGCILIREKHLIQSDHTLLLERGYSRSKLWQSKAWDSVDVLLELPLGIMANHSTEIVEDVYLSADRFNLFDFLSSKSFIFITAYKKMS
jgi:hypothetical protein